MDKPVSCIVCPGIRTWNIEAAKGNEKCDQDIENGDVAVIRGCQVAGHDRKKEERYRAVEKREKTIGPRSLEKARPKGFR